MGNCRSAEAKEIFVIHDNGDLVCPRCGSRHIVRVRNKKSLPLIVAEVLGLCLVAAVGYTLVSGIRGLNKAPKKEPILNEDTVAAVPSEGDEEVIETNQIPMKEEPVKKEKTEKEDNVSTSIAEDSAPVHETSSKKTKTTSLTLSYGTYTGATCNGYPHGQGRLTYTTTRQMNRNDVKKRTAEAGDYVVGEFFNGFIVYGKHYNAQDSLLERVTFGVGSEDSYESK